MENILIIIGVEFIYMTLWFLLAAFLKRNDLADIAWGLGFILIAWLSLFLNNNFSFVLILLASVVSLWGLRLAFHIASRNKGKKEDYRYKEWREKWGKNWLLFSYVKVFLLQGFFMLIIASPIILASYFPASSLKIWQILGLAIWLVGFFFETVADWQLTRFIKNKDKGSKKIMTSGLWQYSRHPNYFGEVAMWWGVWLLALINYWLLLTIISPLLITWLLLKVSGIPMLEKKYKDNPEFQEYKKRTKAFFPWKPKKL
ncbi:MAG: DUF1295 domain-containing protein [Candidatus Pacebacteria bacterium]|nr:DUF1295 domain-containing protein [Candidatus Paceibacterota bacterium]